MQDQPRRARTIEEFKAVRARFDNQAGRTMGLRYRPAPDDVLIATYPKCGTTWMQQMLHCLRTRGDMHFGEITEVVPWIEMAQVMGIDLDAPQRGSPRAFKTHLTYHDIPKGGRYIHVVRDPADVLVSMYHFHEGWYFEPGSIRLDDYAKEIFLAGGPSGKYWDFIASWWPHRDDEHVLYLVYEDALRHPADTIARVASFIGLAADEALLELTLQRTSIGFMKANEHHFDDHVLRAIIDPRRGLPADGSSSKVRKGESGEGRERLGDGVHALLRAYWRERLADAMGLEDYAALRCAVHAQG